MKKKIIASVIACALVLGLIPLGIFASDSVTYNRSTGKMYGAILNTATGRNSAFYNSTYVKADYNSSSHEGEYNAVNELFGVKYSDTVSGVKTCSVADSDNTEYRNSLTWKIQWNGDLYANLSSTLHNYKHSHKKASGLNYEFIVLQWGTNGNSTHITGYDESAKTDPRLGDMAGSSETLVHMRNVGQISLEFDRGSNMASCSCSKSSAANTVVAFYDKTLPTIKSVSWSADSSFYGVSGYFNAGQKVTFTVTFSELIRFCDDTATDKENIKAKLIVEGKDSSTWPEADLVKLDGNKLVFEYTVQDDEGRKTITGIDLSGLFGENLKLVQIGKNGSFSISDSWISANNITDTTGFTTTTCYVTDFAGNAPNKTASVQKNLSTKLVFDTQAPYPESISCDAVTNNQDVKEALGKTSLTTADADYADQSDSYLAAGDSVSYKITFNEELRSTADTAKFKITTNIIRGGSNVVAVSNHMSTNGGKTTISFQPIEIQDGDTVSDESGKILVLSINKQEDNIYIAETLATPKGRDLANNEPVLGTDLSSLNTNPYYLDNSAPVLKDENYVQTGDYFRQDFSIDKGTGSDINGLNAQFSLSSKDVNGNAVSFKYEYVLTSSDTVPEESDWKSAVTDSKISLKQSEGTMHLYLRGVSGEKYDMKSCSFNLIGADYAGNKGESTIAANWKIDNTAPSAVADSVTRKLSGNYGTINVKIKPVDGGSSSYTWEYKWDDGSWTNGSTTGEDAFVAKSGNIAVETTSTCTLYVKLKDDSNNESSEISLGSFTYDLRGAAYELSASDVVNQTAKLTIDSLGSGDTILLVIPADVSGQDYYYVKAITADEASLNAAKSNVFTNGEIFTTSTLDKKYKGRWQIATKSEENNKVTFTVFADYSTNGDNYYKLNKIFDGDYIGNLKVKVYAGKASAFSYSCSEDVNNSRPVYVMDSNSYTWYCQEVTLKLVGREKSNGEYWGTMPYGDPTFTPSFSVGNASSYTDTTFATLATLEGATIEITLGNDVHGWNYQDIDFANSALLIERRNVPNYYATWEQCTVAEVYSVPLQAAKKQTVTLPEVPSGMYSITLQLKTYSGRTFNWIWNPTTTLTGTKYIFFVDNFEPTDVNGITVTTARSSCTGSNGLYGFEKSIDLADGSDYINLPGYSLLDNYNSYTIDGCLTLSLKNTLWNVDSFAVPDILINASSSGSSTACGGHDTYIWNISIGETASNAKKMDRANDRSTSDDTATIQTTHYPYNVGYAKPNNTDLYLQSGENILAIQQVYSNGRKSSIKTITINCETSPSEGDIAFDEDNLVFTPTDNIGAGRDTVYAMVYTDKDATDASTVSPQAMTLQANGTYTLPKEKDGAKYYVYTQAPYGSTRTIGSISDFAPSLSVKSVTTSGKKYTAIFTVTDDLPSGGLDLYFSFGNEYAQAIGADSSVKYKHTLTGSVVQENSPYGGVMGITSVVSKNNQSYSVSYGKTSVQTYEITVEGYLGGIDDGAVQPDFALVMSADSGFSGVASATATLAAAAWDGSAPALTSYTTTTVSGNSKDDYYQAGFNVPVIPAESWMYPDNSNATFNTVWTNAFPITENGSKTISYIDIFGKKWTRTFNITDIPDKYCVHIDLSTTESTTDPVTVSISSSGSDKLFALICNNDLLGNWGILGESGDEVNLRSSKTGAISPQNDVSPSFWIYSIEKEGHEQFEGGNYVNATSSCWNDIHVIQGQLINIKTKAPDASLRFWLDGYENLGELTESELKAFIANNGGSINSAGGVKVWYVTEEYTEPTNELEKHFYKDDALSYTFTYTDGTHNGSITVNLDDYGITMTDGTERYDTKAPDVSVDINPVIGGVVQLGESITAEASDAERTAAFASIGMAQSYRMTVNVTDDSPYEIAISGYEDGAASLAGNTICIISPTAITVTVTDKPKYNPGSPNSTSFTLDKSLFESYIDTTAPYISSKVVSGAAFNVEMYITAALEDKNNAGTVTSGGITVVTPAMEKQQDGTYKITVNENGLVNIILRDAAGNTSVDGVDIQSVNKDAPKLTVSWSPSLESQNQLVGSDQAPTETLANNVTARIKSDVPIYALSMDYSDTDGGSLVSTSAIVSDLNINVPLYFNKASGQLQTTDPGSGFIVERAADSVLISFRDSTEADLYLNVSGPNYKVETVHLYLGNVIDKTSPVINVVRKDIKASGASLAYAYEYSFTPNETVTCNDYGVSGSGINKTLKQITATEPLVLTFRTGGTHKIVFSDLAGNTSTSTITVPDVDSSTPRIVVLTSGALSVVRVSEDCKLTYNGQTIDANAGNDIELNFQGNGSYTLKAVDETGNTGETVIVVGGIDKIQPQLSFTSNTVKIRQDSTAAELKTLLDSGITIYDETTKVSELVLVYDDSSVNLNTAGVYTVTYTVTDKAGNSTSLDRYVKVIDKNQPLICVDGNTVDADSTIALTEGSHIFTAEGLEELSSGLYEPYTISIKKGIYYTGQMKSGRSGTLLGSDGKIDLTEGFYTLLLTTQSKKTVRIIVNVEK